MAQTLNVSPEVQALGQALATAISDIKAKKGAMPTVEDVGAQLLPALAGMANVAVDIKTPDNIAFLVYQLASALGL